MPPGPSAAAPLIVNAEQLSPSSEVEIARYWHALYTRHHFEKSVDRELREKGLQSYLPLRPVLRQWSDRKKWIEEPLFSCYVFVYVDPWERLLSLRPQGVVRMLCTGGQPARIPEWEIETVQRMLAGGYDPQPMTNLARGDLLEITGGPLMGLRGVLHEMRGQHRLIIAFETIGRSVAINVERHQVRKVSTHENSPSMANLHRAKAYAHW